MQPSNVISPSYTSLASIFHQFFMTSTIFFRGTVCPGSSDFPDIFNIFASENEVYHLLTITILEAEYYSFTDQNNIR